MIASLKYDIRKACVVIEKEDGHTLEIEKAKLLALLEEDSVHDILFVEWDGSESIIITLKTGAKSIKLDALC